MHKQYYTPTTTHHSISIQNINPFPKITKESDFLFDFPADSPNNTHVKCVHGGVMLCKVVLYACRMILLSLSTLTISDQVQSNRLLCCKFVLQKSVTRIYENSTYNFSGLICIVFDETFNLCKYSSTQLNCRVLIISFLN